MPMDKRSEQISIKTSYEGSEIDISISIYDSIDIPIHWDIIYIDIAMI